MHACMNMHVHMYMYMHICVYSYTFFRKYMSHQSTAGHCQREAWHASMPKDARHAL